MQMTHSVREAVRAFIVESFMFGDADTHGQVVGAIATKPPYPDFSGWTS